jgi:hypothetical protein
MHKNFQNKTQQNINSNYLYLVELEQYSISLHFSEFLQKGT